MRTRHIAIFVGATTRIDMDKLRAYPGVEVYRIDGPNAEHEIEMALLDDLVTPIRVAFVGGEDARRFAEMYHGTWIEGVRSVEEDLRRFWLNP